QIGKLEGDPVLHVVVEVLVITAAASQAEDVEKDQHHEDCGDRNKAQRHGDAIAAHALAMRVEILRLVIAIVAAAESAAVRGLPGPPASQLWLALDLDAIADDRHNYSDGDRMRSSWLVRPAAGSPGRPRRDHTRRVRDSPPAGVR